MLSVRSHYIGQRGRFLSFTIPDSLLSGVTTPAYFTPTGYSWIYAKSPQVVDIPCARRYDVSIELATVPPEGANINGFNLTVTASLLAGAVSGDLGASAPGVALTVAVSLTAGAVSGDFGASVPGFDLTVTASLAVGGAESFISAPGAALTVAVSFTAGAAFIDPNGSASGFALTVTASLAAGAASSGGVDPNFSSVSLLLHMDGSNGSTAFIDTSATAHSITVFGDAQVTTTSPKFGTGALLLDGTGDYLSAPSHPSLTFGSGDFTIEAWVRFNTVSARQYIFSQRDTGGFALYLLADGRLGGLSPGSNSTTQASATMAVNTWHHVAFTRSGTSHNVWVDGVGSPTGTFSDSGESGTSYIGYRGSGTVELLDGRIDDLRITKGVARYTATFTPPTQSFPDA
jgi:hypothetical protein